MNKRLDDQSSLRPNLPINIGKHGSTKRRMRTKHHVGQQVDNNINVSFQDVRYLAATLYLTEIPGLGGLENDWDSLIDRYYEPIYLSD